MMIINPVEFGADPTGMKDSAWAVERALAAAKVECEKIEHSGRKIHLKFPKGLYRFWADYAPERELYVSNTVGSDQRYKNKKIGILIEDMDHVVVDGGGSLFIYHGDIAAFAVIRSREVLVTNFAFDYESPVVVDVTIEDKVDDQSIIAYVPECYQYEINNGKSITWKGEMSPTTGQPYWSGGNQLEYSQKLDTITGKSSRDDNRLFENVDAIEDMGNNRLKFTYSTSKALPPVGMCYQMRNITRTTPGALIWESSNVTLAHMKAHFLHGFGIVGQLSDTIAIDHVDFVCREGTGRTTAGFADFIQMSSIKGKVKVENCRFANPHDDPINIHGTYMAVSHVSDNQKVFTVKYMHHETAGFPQFYLGDKVEFVRKGTMIPVEKGRGRVVGVINPTPDDLETITITLDRAIPHVTGGYEFAVENITYTPKVEIRNNHFSQTPTRGILVTTRQPVMIEDNYFDAIGMASIYISCDAQEWYESGPTRDVTIRNNVFNRSQDDAILIAPTNPINDPKHRIHGHIKIENNLFNLEGDTAIRAKSVKELSIIGNTFRHDDREKKIGLRDYKEIYCFEACNKVHLTDNSYDDGLIMDDMPITRKH